MQVAVFWDCMSVSSCCLFLFFMACLICSCEMVWPPKASCCTTTRQDRAEAMRAKRVSRTPALRPLRRAGCPKNLLSCRACHSNCPGLWTHFLRKSCERERERERRMTVEDLENRWGKLFWFFKGSRFLCDQRIGASYQFQQWRCVILDWTCDAARSFCCWGRIRSKPCLGWKQSLVVLL